MNKYILILSLCVFGCSNTLIPRSKIEPDKYISLMSVSAGFAAISDESPNIKPIIPENSVRRPSECNVCQHKGWLGDGRPRSDCPDCDFNGDGDNDDPMSVFSDTITEIEQKDFDKNEELKNREDSKKNTPVKKYEFSDKDLDLDESTKVKDLIWYKNTKDAVDNSSGKKEIVVLLSKSDPSEIWKDKKVVEFLSKNYVLLYASTESIPNENAWASYGKESLNVNKIRNIYEFKGDVFCVLNSEGNFTSQSNLTYIDLPNSPEELIKAITNYNKLN